MASSTAVDRVVGYRVRLAADVLGEQCGELGVELVAAAVDELLARLLDRGAR